MCGIFFLYNKLQHFLAFSVHVCVCVFVEGGGGQSMTLGPVPTFQLACSYLLLSIPCQLTNKLTRILLSLSLSLTHSRKTASQIHVSSKVLGFWTHVLILSSQMLHPWGISPISKELFKSKLMRQMMYLVPEWSKVARVRCHQPPWHGICSFCIFLCGNRESSILPDFWEDYPVSHSDAVSWQISYDWVGAGDCFFELLGILEASPPPLPGTLFVLCCEFFEVIISWESADQVTLPTPHWMPHS